MTTNSINKYLTPITWEISDRIFWKVYTDQLRSNYLNTPWRKKTLGLYAGLFTDLVFLVMHMMIGYQGNELHFSVICHPESQTQVRMNGAFPCAYGIHYVPFAVQADNLYSNLVYGLK